jgi:hypothetical protein
MHPDAHTIAAADVVAHIHVVRGQRVLIDGSLAQLYEVSTKALNQAVTRNQQRFPRDFMFQLIDSEWVSLRSQFVTLNRGRGGHRKFLPYAFTEHGAIMAATILNSPRAVQMSVHVVRAFVHLRKALASNAVTSHRLAALEQSVAALDKETRRQFDTVFEAILGLMGPAPQRQ